MPERKKKIKTAQIVALLEAPLPQTPIGHRRLSLGNWPMFLLL